jgi:hypothetical protein
LRFGVGWAGGLVGFGVGWAAGVGVLADSGWLGAIIAQRFSQQVDGPVVGCLAGSMNHGASMKDEQRGSASGAVTPRPLLADYRHLTPLEYLSLADRERIHTETLRWLLGEDSPINASARLGILEKLARRRFPDGIIAEASTEDRHIDLLVCLDFADGRHHVAIENKLKSAEHTLQLARYDSYLDTLGDCTKLFLTLVGENPQSSSSWLPVPYALLHEAVLSVTPHTHSDYVADYERLLRRLVGAIERVVDLPDAYAGNGVVF